MKICTKCNKTADDNMNFCTFCGNPLTTVQPEQEIKPNTYYTPQQNPYYPAYNLKKPPLGLKITAMVLSILGFVYMIFGFLYTLIGLVEEDMAFAMAFTFALFFLPLSIVGLSLSAKCINQGDTSTFSRLGKVFGIIGIILAAVSLFIGFVSSAGI